MKDEILSIIFDRFYKNLRDKFYEEFGTRTIKKESKEIWKETYKKTKQNIAADLFELSNPFYFHRKYDEEVKQHMNFGYPSYPVTIDKHQMHLALKYLLWGRNFELIKNFPSISIEKFRKEQKEEKFQILLELFIKKAFPGGIDQEIEAIRKAQKTDIVDNKRFLSEILSTGKMFHPRFLENLISSYFDALTQKNYLKAWTLMSPEFQQNSIWNGSFELFCRSYKNVSSIGTAGEIWFSSFRYSFLRASCTVKYYEEGTILDAPKNLYDLDHASRVMIIEKVNPLVREAKILQQYVRKAKLKKLRHFWIRPIVAADFSKVDVKDLQDIDFLKAASLLKLLRNDFHQKYLDYRASIISNVSVKPIGDQWLISRVSSGSLTRTKEYYEKLKKYSKYSIR